MNSDEALYFLTVASQYNGKRYTQQDAKSWAGMMPEWITPKLAAAGVESLFRQDGLDGTHHLLTPPALVEACRVLKGTERTKREVTEPGVLPKSVGAKASATFSDVVNRVRHANPDRDMNVRSHYFWVLNTARGVLDSSCDIRGVDYPADVEY